MKLFVLLATLVTLASCETGNEDADILAAISGTGQISLEVEHSFDNGKSFVPRGTLNIHSLRSSSASLDSVAAVTDGTKPARKTAKPADIVEAVKAGTNQKYLYRPGRLRSRRTSSWLSRPTVRNLVFYLSEHLSRS